MSVGGFGHGLAVTAVVVLLLVGAACGDGGPDGQPTAAPPSPPPPGAYRFDFEATLEMRVVEPAGAGAGAGRVWRGSGLGSLSVEVDEDGRIAVDELEANLRERGGAVSLAVTVEENPAKGSALEAVAEGLKGALFLELDVPGRLLGLPDVITYTTQNRGPLPLTGADADLSGPFSLALSGGSGTAVVFIGERGGVLEVTAFEMALTPTGG